MLRFSARQWYMRLFASAQKPVRPGPSPFHRLVFEPLTDRITPAQFTVTNTADTGAGSLRAAVDAANTLSGTNTIVFAPGLAGATDS